jgi:hypothetical protein
MSWPAQLWHVMKKDLWQVKGLLAAYVAIIGVAIWNTTLGSDAAKPVFESAMVLVIAVGTFIAATLVQSDSPTRSDVFWASRPFYRSAVFGAKLASVLVAVLGPGLIGDWIVLAIVGVPPAQVVALLADAGATYGIWITVPIVAAALTRDLRSFVVLMVSGFAALLLALVAVAQRVSVVEYFHDSALYVIPGVLGGLLLVWYLYRTRDTRWWTWVAGAVAVLFALGAVTRPAVQPPELPELKRPVTLGFTVDRGETPAEGPGFDFTLDGMRAGERYELVSGSVLLSSRRDSIRVPVMDAMHAFTLGGAVAAQERSSKSAITGAIEHARYDGRLLVERQSALTLPLREGAGEFWNGRRVTVRVVQRTAGAVLIGLELRQVQGGTLATPGVDPDLMRRTTFLLEHEQRNTVPPLNEVSRASATHALVIPGANVRNSWLWLRAADGTQMNDVHLELVQWVPIGSMPISATYTAP